MNNPCAYIPMDIFNNLLCLVLLYLGGGIVVSIVLKNAPSGIRAFVAGIYVAVIILLWVYLHFNAVTPTPANFANCSSVIYPFGK